MSEDIQDNVDTHVVSIEAVRATKTHHALTQIEAYWEGLRAGRLVPNRQDVDPRGLSGVLSNAFVLERIAPGLGRFRVSGGHLTDLMGMEVRGMPISALFEAADRDGIRDALEAVFSEPATARLHLSSPRGIGRPALSGEMLLLPLKSDLGDVTRILGGVVMDGDVGRAPRRFSITGQSRRTLIGYGEPQNSRETKQVAAAFSAPKSEAAFLRLVSDNGERVD